MCRCRLTGGTSGGGESGSSGGESGSGGGSGSRNGSGGGTARRQQLLVGIGKPQAEPAAGSVAARQQAAAKGGLSRHMGGHSHICHLGDGLRLALDAVQEPCAWGRKVYMLCVYIC